MNCANHAERTATAFCQNCGKPLCPECTRTADNLILCEPCLVARPRAEAQSAGWAQASSSAGAPATAGPGFGQQGIPPFGQQGGYRPVAGSASFPPHRGNEPKPVVAGLLGFIPGVGAMYNGQFVKALLHVVVFIVLIGVTEHFDLAGILIPAWIFYQVFDAAQTAAARRDGRPLPDPFGLLDMSQRLGTQAMQQGPLSPQRPQAGYPPYAPQQPGSSASSSAVPGSAPYAAPPVSAAGAWPGAETGVAPAATPGWGSSLPQGYVRDARGEWTSVPHAAAGPLPNPLPGAPALYPVPTRRGEPVGAIVLIVVGLLFLLSTLGVLDVDWITRGWPVLLLLLGVWLLVRRARATPAYVAPPAYVPAQAPASPQRQATDVAAVRNPLSITPDPAAAPGGETQRPATETGTWPHEEDKQ